MAICEFAVKRLIPPGSSDPRITVRATVLHVDGSNAGSLHDYFDGPSGGIESHFHVRLDGVLEQYRDTAFQADANLDANDFAISVETQGYGSGKWNAAQLATIKRLLLWINKHHPQMRLAKIQSAYGSGVGYHIQFGSPGPWTPVAKSCPGPDRIKQYDTIIVPWLNQGAPSNTEEDYMATPAGKAQLDKIEEKIDGLEEKIDFWAKKTRERDIRIATRAAKKAGVNRDVILAAIDEDDAENAE